MQHIYICLLSPSNLLEDLESMVLAIHSLILLFLSFPTMLSNAQSNQIKCQVHPLLLVVPLPNGHHRLVTLPLVFVVQKITTSSFQPFGLTKYLTKPLFGMQMVQIQLQKDKKSSLLLMVSSISISQMATQYGKLRMLLMVLLMHHCLTLEILFLLVKTLANICGRVFVI